MELENVEGRRGTAGAPVLGHKEPWYKMEKVALSGQMYSLWHEAWRASDTLEHKKKTNKKRNPIINTKIQ